jgi:hypothetical protein
MLASIKSRVKRILSPSWTASFEDKTPAIPDELNYIIKSKCYKIALLADLRFYQVNTMSCLFLHRELLQLKGVSPDFKFYL